MRPVKNISPPPGRLFHNIFFSKNLLLQGHCNATLYDKGLVNPLPDDKILDWSKLKQTADDILKCIQNGKQVPCRVENIVRKGEIACHKQFLHFSQCFPQLYIFSAQNVVMCGNGLT